jgi:hypothetical protein
MNYSKNLYLIILFSCISFLAGLFFFAYMHEYIIFKFPSFHADITLARQQLQDIKRSISLHCWRNNRWHTEIITTLAYTDKSQTILHMINSVLTLLQEESISTKKVLADSVLLSADERTAYVSFNRNPFNKEESVLSKWMYIETLLKTIRENNAGVNQVYFLVNHQPLKDMHLDFTNPWPIKGFLESDSENH